MVINQKKEVINLQELQTVLRQQGDTLRLAAATAQQITLHLQAKSSVIQTKATGQKIVSPPLFHILDDEVLLLFWAITYQLETVNSKAHIWR
ncbi:MAG: hypothetical protein COB03_18625 [Alteromonas sp.]|nr:MAG: hypothetical protein COB03_18625 [Alteromonas sp.]